MSTVTIAPYSPDWPLAFAQLRDELLRYFAPLRVEVEHIGSTAVPGLSAKPVIDVLLGADSLAAIETRIVALARSGYAYRPTYEMDLPLRRYFVRAEGVLPRVHLHAVVIGSAIWREHLAYRDALRSNDHLLDAYQSLKVELADRFRHDKSAYQAAKGSFIRQVISYATHASACDASPARAPTAAPDASTVP